MNSLLSQLLINLAQKEAAEKELLATVESLEILVAAILTSLGEEKTDEVISTINRALDEMRARKDETRVSDIDLLSANIERITAVVRRR
ncbi:sigma-S stabilization anti-adapter protein IraP [Biostraticola tofi]|uniref:Sigma-S stabilization anti-adaptor protein n=1 Tax=Biostraticola tofi TaxID=466109 RepID=A0A4R3YYA4_9GAMM|nr:sigma-S stabilization anti-adapter protein IraP [Biostraticola tofi]TCV98195.1 sigma-S stabilization anti-adaptor protein [Biostraticola tofi]